MIVTPGNPTELAKAQAFDSNANDAEILDQAERIQGYKFKNLDKDSYPIRSIKVYVHKPDLDEGYGFKRGDKVQMTPHAANSAALCGDKTYGVVSGIIPDSPLIRVNGVAYAANFWELA